MAHPDNPDYVLERCSTCEVIRSYNIWTGECKIVYTQSAFSYMCGGPNNSILVQDNFHCSPSAVFELKWEKELQELRVTRCVFAEGELLQKFCHVEATNILVIMNENKEIKAVKFENKSPIWTLSPVVGSHVIKPDAVSSDTEGNVYVSDGANNKILKLNALTGDIIHIVLLAEENKYQRRRLFWSDTEPKLTTMCGSRIRTYNILKLL